MVDNEIDIILLTDDGYKYSLDVPQSIIYNDLKEILKKLIFRSAHFYIFHQKKKYNQNSLNEIIKFKSGDIILGISTIVPEDGHFPFFHKNVDADEAKIETIQLTGILLVYLLRFIAEKITNVEVIKSNTLKNIIYELKKGIDLINNPHKDIKVNLVQNKGSNLITYQKYINQLIQEKDIQYLINLFDNNIQKEIISYWNQLSKYEKFNQLFEKEFSKVIEKSYFEYSLIEVSIYQLDNRKEYLKEREEHYRFDVVKYLFYGFQIDPISKNIINDILYSCKPFYGMGIYFSDMLDYISFYNGGNNYKDRSKNIGKTLQVGDTFSCISAETYYDNDYKKKFMTILIM